ncbi:MAG: hypothetical protein A2898_05795 [Candidatus Kerfeldbacteria bacterium RIFCSPLOWO2_01_FULL_48_11]|uniref:Metallo-beta-lactamase domain-containing protein n=1 Tax=Candidatus Kerfeldbacteria bacterium RIFCSPLOWO2_01_FULL_48_11 TaxID=1798543 RepID=A0A1G2B3C0_9BACT|nr:MAG: internalization-related competence protein ComEC/Rec2 protein [Parcubacteria group bacterium GW2011_GWA2_48_9]KKW15187.1 MAG: internalization-related competence protein ComEC/Rec2 protein [Parcubacteria group bacterium GW2011_GWC2_49_9]OGY83664.1 MAG: hypothetical protein A2898_05795 [Candidatus Kerfeldbacteria bacterium RIFCSPLOWO2_01_FULL_48_11]HCM67961.1 hypothetical protein [Candidatus Kerfeldbacteria bacterium]
MIENKRKKIGIYLLGVTAILATLFSIAYFQKNDLLEVTFLNVGQGDSILIETPSGQVILIDGGPDTSVLAELGRALPFYERTIDLMVLTHGDADHVTGQIEVLHRYDVRNVLYTGVVGESAGFRAWEDSVAHELANILTAIGGTELDFGEVRIGVLYPFENLSGKSFEDVNDTSVQLKLVYGSEMFLFTGDASSEVEKQLLHRGVDVSADVLKIGHHGSRSSSSSEFIEAVTPDIGVIQAGKDNSFGHPHEEVLERLDAADVEVLRNDQLGRITLVSDGHKVWMK